MTHDAPLRILVTGSTDGIGRATAEALLDEGHRVAVHARSQARLAAIRDLLDRGVEPVVGDLSRLDGMHELVEQANALGRFDTVIHNAGTVDPRTLLPVNTVAPYLLSVGMHRPDRLIYVSSGMHRGGRADLSDIDWTGDRATHSYSDSKLFVTTLMAAFARRWPTVVTHAVCPGWVATKMSGSGATDDLSLAHVTQMWLATSDETEALSSGRYWFHRQVEEPHPAVHDEAFQEALLASLADCTGRSVAR